MSKLMSQEEINEIEETFDDDIADSDYCFVFDSEGQIKSIILPESVPFVAPETIAQVLKLLGINDIGEIDGDGTLH